MKKFLLAGVALSALLGGSAGAADLARPAPVHAPPPVIVPLFTWTGCYVGGNAGGIWARNDWNDTVFGDFGNNTASGGLGGLQGGCNYQVGAWVFGIQGDYDWTSINSTSANPALTALANAAFLPGGFAFTDQTQLKSLGSVTGRVGYSWDRFLAYVKAGGAWLQTSYTLQNAGVAIATASSTQSGWTVGVGGEYAFLNWRCADRHRHQGKRKRREGGPQLQVRPRQFLSAAQLLNREPSKVGEPRYPRGSFAFGIAEDGPRDKPQGDAGQKIR